MKYNEEEILKQVIEYIQSTYNQHYSTDGKGLQAMDIFRNMDIDMDFSQANAIKYLMRYGKKQGRNEKRLIQNNTLYCTSHIIRTRKTKSNNPKRKRYDNRRTLQPTT